MRKRPEELEPHVQTDKPEGAFTPSGSWNEDAWIRHRGDMHRLIVALCRRRRRGDLTPKQAASAVEATHAFEAFPSWRQWQNIDSWPFAFTATSAEATVKYCGAASTGHWCGETWSEGPEGRCSNPIHDAVDDPARTRILVDALLASLEKL